MPSDKTNLRRMILDQSVSGAAVPMVLFTDDTLAAPAAEPLEVVTRIAAEQGIDLDTLDLFTYDAYRLQSALGEELAP